MRQNRVSHDTQNRGSRNVVRLQGFSQLVSYCLKPDCRKARTRESQRVWLAKPENQNYFRDEKNAERVRNWQKEHPGYWKNTARYRRRTLQDGCSEQPPAAQAVVETTPSRTLQD